MKKVSSSIYERLFWAEFLIRLIVFDYVLEEL